MDRKSSEAAVAEKLLQVSAVKLQPEHPFTWASGWKSPIYCDNRQVLSFPFVRDFIKSELCSVVFESFPEANALAGVATAGIAWGAMVADQLKLPFAYVRPKPKEHGLGNQIEGKIGMGDKVIVVEDLVSTGMSSLKAVEAIKSAGAEVSGMVSIFTYGFPQAETAFANAGVKLISLTNYDRLLEVGLQNEIIQPDQFSFLLNWKQDPGGWTKLQESN